MEEIKNIKACIINAKITNPKFMPVSGGLATIELESLIQQLAEARALLEPFVFETAINETPRKVLISQLRERRAVADYFKKYPQP